MKKILATLLLPMTLAGLTAASQAAVVNYNFALAGSQVPAGAGGSFSFESTSAQNNVFGETQFVLLSFSFSFASNTFGLTGLDGDAGLAIFDGTSLRGLEAVGDGGTFSFMPATPNTSAFLVWNGTRGGQRSFDLSFQPGPNQVPEPGTAFLVATLLAAGWALRRGRWPWANTVQPKL